MDNLDLSNPACILLVGKPRKGKTTALKYLLLKNSLDRFYGSANFEFGLIFSRSKFTGEYDFIENQDYVYEDYDDSILEQYLNGLKNLLEKGKDIPLTML
jgi:hypothetical protein